jgi:hypothetical protein
MKSIEEIRFQLQAGQFEFSRHAFRRIIEHNISEQEIREVGDNVIIIEDYPEDKYSPSCLLLGLTQNERSLHLQVSRMASDVTKIMTIYEPDASQWINYTQRR